MGIITETNYFGNFEQEEAPKALIIPTPYEYTSNYNKGTKNGPQAILNASTQLEKFDDELGTEISEIGINTSNFLSCEFVNNKSKQQFSEVEDVVRNTIISGFLPVILGGEHSVSYGAIKAVYDLYPEVSILYFDAHSDLKSSFQNNKFNSLCNLRRICELMPDVKIIHVGTRAISQEEAEWIDSNNPNIEFFFARDKYQWKIPEMIAHLTKNVYISFDFSVLDSGIMPSCSMPEPGGLNWEQAIDIIRNVCAFKEIVGMDFTEFAPISGLNAPDYLAAKLIYKSLGYTFARQLGAFEDNESLLVNNQT